MLEDVKVALRVTAPEMNGEVQDLIDAALLDLTISGVVTTSEDALIKRAVISYCRAYFGYDNPEAERFEHTYRTLRRKLSVSGDYRAT